MLIPGVGERDDYQSEFENPVLIYDDEPDSPEHSTEADEDTEVQ